MTPVNPLELDFADGIYLFNLKLPQIAELQEKQGPIGKVYARVRSGRWVREDTDAAIGLPTQAEFDVFDLLETIRLALIGGGAGRVNEKDVKVTPLLAKSLVERYCHTASLRDVWDLAAAILAARFEGYTPPGGDQPADEPATQTSQSNSGGSSTIVASSEPIGEN